MSTYPGSGTYPGAARYPSQDGKPIHEVLISFDDASESTPTWHYIIDRLRGYSINRGRGNELSRVDAGTETLTLDNRDRALDPTNTTGPWYPNVTPMNRVWHRVRYAGETIDLFKGYVESWPQSWPDKVADAVATVTVADEFKVLALGKLPASDPPRDSYAELVKFDQPSAYWRMSGDPTSGLQDPVVGGPVLVANNGMSGTIIGAIVGDEASPSNCVVLANNQALLGSGITNAYGGPDVGGLTEFTVELWYKVESPRPSGNVSLVIGPYSTLSPSPVLPFNLFNSSDGTVGLTVTTDAGATTVTGAAITTDTWHHIVGILAGGTVTLYIDATVAASGSRSGTFAVIDNDLISTVFVGGPVSTATTYFDEVAIYRSALTADRVREHYMSGVGDLSRGQRAGARLAAILDIASSHAPRTLQAGQRPLAGRYMTGQAPLDEMRTTEAADAVDAVLFISKSGEVTFLDSAHRSSAPYDAPIVTFADDTIDALRYTDLQVDYSDSYLANKWDVTRTSGTTLTASDDASIARYFARPQALTDLALTDDTDAQDVADAMLAKYKTPFFRVTSISPLTSDAGAFLPIMRREIGDRIEVIRNPPGGGDPIDEEVFLQSISITQSADDPFPTVTWGVSPV